jgi:hypothetical protein
MVMKSSRMVWQCHVEIMEDIRNSYCIMTANPQVKEPLGKPRCRGKCNISKDQSDMRVRNVYVLTEGTGKQGNESWSSTKRG